ncbi:hypothetical protein CDD83_6802 [Cordyceps sp. RAO-2017]|nr:hypothetical protein CDD83_6802 [Cordyceps sp. RAO-2017]
MEDGPRVALAPRDGNVATKRRGDGDGVPPTKRVRRDESRSPSPEGCSVFDTSAADTTAATEAEVLPARALTREEARHKVEILRLRLGLASYKLRTGQTSVPLQELRLLPLRPGDDGAGRPPVR